MSMSMGEPRRRVKYSIDPNALNWAQDESKFGKRLMEKMGWQNGTGLGANSNGMTEHIKVKFKTDTKGVGYNNNDYDNVWLDHQDDFESILSELNKASSSSIATTTTASSQSNDKPINTLAQKSKERAKRLHYSKFTKSKDLSTASQNDLACILGTDKRIKLKNNKTNSSGDDDNDESQDAKCFSNNSFLDGPKQIKKSDENNNNNNLLFSTNTLSIGDYFAQKMKEKLNKQNTINSLDVLNQEEEQEEETESKKKKKKKKSTKEEVIIEKEEEIIVKKKKKKKNLNELVEQVQIIEEEKEEEIKIEKKIKKKNKEDSFKGSNLNQLYGYSPYNITCNLDDILNERNKKANRKRLLVEVNLQKDSKFYEMSKKPACAILSDPI